MTVVAEPPIFVPLPTPDAPGRVLLRGISWDIYQKLRDAVCDSPVHFTYDAGFLEIEVPSERHEELKELAGELVVALLQHARFDYRSLGSTTWNRKQLLKGIEADKCYYVQSLPLVAHKEVDLSVDPPPDLAVEVEVTSSAIDKLRIYGELRVPEVWRIRNDGSLKMLKLNASGEYDPLDSSAVVPGAAASLIEIHLKLMRPVGPLLQSAVARLFRESLTSR